MWEIDHQCPQCSAPVVLEETERLFSCPYCKVKLLIAARDSLSYYLGNPPFDDETIFVPYRRSRGVEFTCTSMGVGGAVVDKTSLAPPLTFPPRSMGIRPQALRLRFVTKDLKGRFATPSDPAEDSHLSESRQVVLPGYADERIPVTVSMRRFLPEAGSFIYSPFRLLGTEICDAISMDVVGQADLTERFDELQAHPPSSQPVFVPALCPNCGKDLVGDKKSVALPCINCGVLWETLGSGLSERPFLSLPSGESADDWCLPFWRIKARVKGMEIPFFIDPAKSAPPASGRRPILFDEFYFWTPAFAINPTLFLRLAERATVWQPTRTPIRFAEKSETRNLYPVTLSASRAGSLLPIILSLVVAQREAALIGIVKGTIEPGESTLVFVPFKKAGLEIRHREMRASLLMNALTYGRRV
jgi:DNA-directed RNA polymerase subunit RPC12/RpoP